MNAKVQNQWFDKLTMITLSLSKGHAEVSPWFHSSAFSNCHPEPVEGWALDLIWNLNFGI